MDIYTQAVELVDQSTLTVRAWTLEEIGENGADFEKLIDAVAAPITGQPSPFAEGVAPRVMRRIIMRSLVYPEDVDRIRAPDLEEVLEAIYQVNGLRELSKKSLALRLRRQEAQKEALLAHPSA